MTPKDRLKQLMHDYDDALARRDDLVTIYVQAVSDQDRGRQDAFRRLLTQNRDRLQALVGAMRLAMDEPDLDS